MEEEIKKAIIPVAGLGTRFLPLSKALPKEFFPLADKPTIQYIVEEAKNSGISEIIFIVSPSQKMVLDYFQKDEALERALIRKKKDAMLKELKDFDALFENIKINFITQRKPLGDGHAILQAEKFINDEPVAILFADDIVYGDEPALSQLINMYKTCKSPVMALKKIDKEKLVAYGVPKVEKIAHHFYKIKKIIEKPKVEELPSEFAIVGKHILTPEVFKYLKKAKPSEKGEIILAEVYDKMLLDGKAVYGYEIKGEWLECGDKEKWLKSFFYIALKNERYGQSLKQYLKQIM